MIGVESVRRIARAARRAFGPGLAVGLAASSFAWVPGNARAETIGGAIAKAYLNNPDINQQRAATRSADENIPTANAGFLPTVTTQANAGILNTQGQNLGAAAGNSLFQTSEPRGYGMTVTENVFNGNKTANSVRSAESNVLAQREQLRYTEQNVLQSVVQFYMDVLHDTAVLDLDKSNVEVLQEQLRQTRDRFNVGEVTRTDVAQAEASLAGAQATALTAQSTLQTSIANYRQVIGDQPRSLAPVAPLTKPLPRSLTDAIAISQVENPVVVANLHGIDIKELAVKISEAALYPTANLQGSLTQAFDVSGFPNGSRTFASSLVGNVTIPIYDGGATYAGIRQAKENLGQQELATDLARDKVRQQVVAAWGMNATSTGVVRAAKAQVDAAEVALAGVREEAKVGQRTTLDVLNAQQTLLNARVQLVTAQHDQVVNSYALLQAVGRLSVKNLGLSVAEYDPRVHFDQVRHKWWGVRTPDGK